MKNEKLIMVINKELLFNGDYFQGFKPQNKVDYESRILKNFTYMKRGLAEEDANYKQPIGYALIVNPDLKKVFAFQRSAHDSNYSEKRLQGKWSWGVGGHIEKFDLENVNPISVSMLRELKEEVIIGGSVKSKVLGYINDDSDDVGKVHFGILYVFETTSSDIKQKDSEIDNGRLRSIKELEEICLNPNFRVEGWSKIVLEPLKEYLQY